MRAAVMTALATGVAMSAAGSAAAAPKELFQVDLTCSDGKAYSVEGNGNGEFTPVRDRNGDAVFIPVGFGTFTGTITAPGGGESFTFTEEAYSKGSGEQKVDLTAASPSTRHRWTTATPSSPPERPSSGPGRSCSEDLALAARLPQHVAARVGHAGQDEQQVREPVEVERRLLVRRVRLAPPAAPRCAARRGGRPCGPRAAAPPPGCRPGRMKL